MPMSTRHVLVVLTLLACSACRTPQAPPRPLANMYPSLEPAAILETLQPRPIAADWLRQQLAALDLDRQLQLSGFPDHDWALLARGLSRRGYAEIDARKTGSPLRWITFRAPAGTRQLIVTAAFDALPAAATRSGLQPDRTPPARTDTTAEGQSSEWQTRLDSGPLLILRSLLPARPGTPRRWQIIILIPDATRGNPRHETAH